MSRLEDVNVEFQLLSSQLQLFFTFEIFSKTHFAVMQRIQMKFWTE
jgi:hypothetical protein